MGTDLVVQFGILLLTLGIFYALHQFPKQALTRIRSKGRSTAQAHRHFVHGAQLLARARSLSSRNKTTFHDLAKSAAGEADKALAFEPRDAAAHILKALALDLMGHKTSALRSLDAALSSPAVKSLSERERGDALLKRAEFQVALNRRGRRVDSAVADLQEAVKLSQCDNGKAFCLLGQCYELKGMREEAKNAFEQALRVQPDLAVAREGLARMGSS